MLDLKKIFRVIKRNKDVIALYRIKIYNSKSKLLKWRIFRYIFLLQIIFKKYILHRDLIKEREKIKTNVSYYTENKISKRINLAVALKKVVEKEIVFIDVLDVILHTNVYEDEINGNIENSNLFEINQYGKTICDVLEQNNKEVYLLLHNKKLSKDFIKELLNKNEIYHFKDILYYSNDIKEKNNDISKIIQDKFAENKKFVYIGDYFKENISNNEISFLLIAYENCRVWGEKFRPKNNEKSIQMSIYSSILNNTLHEGINTYNRSYEFGFCYGGIISYYLLVQMIKNKQTFIKQYNKFKQDLYNDFGKNKLIDIILDLTFPKIVNNLIYDGTQENKNIDLQDLNFRKQYHIQQGIIDFVRKYEELLTKVNNNNEIEYAQIKEIFEFLLSSKNTEKMIKELSIGRNKKDGSLLYNDILSRIMCYDT